MKKKFVALALFLMVLIMSMPAGGRREAPKAGGLNVALSVVWEGNSYAVQSREEFYAEVERQRARGKINNVWYLNSDFSAEKQVSDLEDLFTRDVDILIIQAVHPPAVSNIIERFHRRGTIVIACVSPLATQSYTLSMIADDAAFGRAGAQFLVDKLGGRGNIIALDGMDGITVAIDRWRGAQEVFSKHPGITVLSKVFANWDYADGKTATENMLAAFPRIDGVWSSGGDMTRGAIEAFQEARRPLIPMMGEDNNGFLKAWVQVRGRDRFAAIGCSMPTYFFADALVHGINIKEGTTVVGRDIPKDNILEVYEITDANLMDFVRMDLSDSFWANTKMDEATLQRLFGLR